MRENPTFQFVNHTLELYTCAKHLTDTLLSNMCIAHVCTFRYLMYNLDT